MGSYWEGVVLHAVRRRGWDDVRVHPGRGVSVVWVVRRHLGVASAPSAALVSARAAARRLRRRGLVSLGVGPGDLVGGCSGRFCKVGMPGELEDVGESGIRWQGVVSFVGMETGRRRQRGAVDPAVVPVHVVTDAVVAESGLSDVQPAVVAVLERLIGDGWMRGVRAPRQVGGGGGELVGVEAVRRSVGVVLVR